MGRIFQTKGEMFLFHYRQSLNTLKVVWKLFSLGKFSVWVEHGNTLLNIEKIFF